MPTEQRPKCPRCGSGNVRKAAHSIRQNTPIQRYMCKKCWRGFSEPK